MAGSGLSIGLSGNLVLDIHLLDCFARNKSMEACRARRLPRLPELPALFTSNNTHLNVFVIIVLTGSGAPVELGIGPLLVAPTASDDALGQGKWQAGVAAVAVKHLSGGAMFFSLLTWQTDFAGDGDRADVNLLTAQPGLNFQLGGGLYLRSTAVWQFDFENERYLIPFGLGAGKVFRFGKTVASVFAEPQFSAYHKGSGHPALQLFCGLNLQWFK